VEDAIAANEVFKQKIDDLTEANRLLAIAEDQIAQSSADVSAAISKISTAKTIQEFRAYQLAALETIKLNAQVLISALNVQK
jgi:hypothetical protein